MKAGWLTDLGHGFSRKLTISFSGMVNVQHADSVEEEGLPAAVFFFFFVLLFQVLKLAEALARCRCTGGKSLTGTPGLLLIP